MILWHAHLLGDAFIEIDARETQKIAVKYMKTDIRREPLFTFARVAPAFSTVAAIAVLVRQDAAGMPR